MLLSQPVPLVAIKQNLVTNWRLLYYIPRLERTDPQVQMRALKARKFIIMDSGVMPEHRDQIRS